MGRRILPEKSAGGVIGSRQAHPRKMLRQRRSGVQGDRRGTGTARRAGEEGQGTPSGAGGIPEPAGPFLSRGFPFGTLWHLCG